MPYARRQHLRTGKVSGKRPEKGSGERPGAAPRSAPLRRPGAVGTDVCEKTAEADTTKADTTNRHARTGAVRETVARPLPRSQRARAAAQARKATQTKDTGTRPTRPTRPVRKNQKTGQKTRQKTRQKTGGRKSTRLRPTRTRRAAAHAHALVDTRDNERLQAYEHSIKSSFDGIVPVLKRISALQHETDFAQRAQQIAKQELGFTLPEDILADAWVEQLDMRRLFAWCVFATYQQFCDAFFDQRPLETGNGEEFESFLQECGFHTMDITPCADGRLAHLIRYVVRLPYRAVRRKSYAGAMFDIEDSIQKWVEVEMLRFREGRPNHAADPTRYLKVVAYHYSSVDPAHEGCAAHGSDTAKAAKAGLDRLEGFRQAIENSFCCGASIDLLLIGVDTDTDALRVHVPNQDGMTDLENYVDTRALFEQTTGYDALRAREEIQNAVLDCTPDVTDGMARLIGKLIENNFSQIAYVKSFHGDHYEDIGHAERFIGAGVGFEEIQLRNLMYFAYLNTVEEATPDLDVGIKIFTGLNVGHGLPVPIVVRFDYHGHVPGGRDRAVRRCQRVSDALQSRYSELFNKGLLHIMQVVRDCQQDTGLEVLACTARGEQTEGIH